MGPSSEFGKPVLQVPDYQWENMREYVRDCADRMGLRDYTCNYFRERPDQFEADGVCAGIEVSPTRRHFTLWLPYEWFRKAGGTPDDREEARATVAHELMHVHMKRIEGVCEAVKTNLGDIAWATWRDILHDEIEIMVDDVAEVAARALPLPDMPQKPPTLARKRQIAKK